MIYQEVYANTERSIPLSSCVFPTKIRNFKKKGKFPVPQIPSWNGKKHKPKTSYNAKIA